MINNSPISGIKLYKIQILMVFSFILGSMLTINIMPVDKTCNINSVEKESDVKHSKEKEFDLIVLILSSQNNLEKRNTIRETWLKLRSLESDSSIKFKMKYYFVLGSLGLSFDQTMHLSTEQSRYADMLILPIHDGYENLTGKVLNSFKWLNDKHEVGLNFKYVLKCDDDSFVRLDTLSTVLLELEETYLIGNSVERLEIVANEVNSPYLRFNIQANNKSSSEIELYWGYFDGRATVKRAGKWKEKSWIFCDRYLPYALGGGYVLSRNLIRYLARNAGNLRHFKSEDTSLGAWLAPVDNILRLHDTRFDTEWKTRGCQNTHIITHSVSIEKIHEMYTLVKNKGVLCASEVVNRRSYLYNWAVPPSLCCK